MILREPTHIAQMLATLDELSGGRAEAVVSFGNLGMLEPVQHRVEGDQAVSRVREGMEVMRRFLEDGAITFDGEFFSTPGCSPSPGRCRSRSR